MEDFNTETTVYAEEPKKRLPWVWIVLGGIVALIVVLVIVALFVRRGAVEPTMTEEMAKEQEMIDDACADAPDPEACRANRLATLISSQADPTMCDQLGEDYRDSCYTNAAREAGEPSICDNIDSAGIKESCLNVAYRVRAELDQDESLCDSIAEERYRGRCHDYFTSVLTAASCREQGREPTLCVALEVTEEALAKRDPDICDQLPIADAAGCRDFVTFADRDFDDLPEEQERKLGTDDRNPDSDGDGLNDGEEVRVYGSDPANPDTDGDGFNDGSEVANGYSPIGPGEL